MTTSADLPEHRRRLSAGLTSLLSLALLLGGTEIVLRILHVPFETTWTPSENAMARFDPELGWAYLPDRSYVREFGDDEREVSIHFDSMGSRVGSPDVLRDGDRPTVVFVGGSYTMGQGLPYEETFVGQLDADPEFPFQVVNLGVQAYGTDQSLLLLQRHIERFRCVAVVYTFIDAHVKRNENHDRRLIVPSARFLGTKPLFGLRGDGTLFLRKRPARHEEKFELNLWNWMRLAWHRNGPRPGPDLTWALVDRMQEVARTHGAELVVVVWRQRNPESVDVVIDWDDPGRERSASLNLVDTTAGPPSGWEDWVIPGDGHPDIRAHTLVAEMLLQKFAGLGMIPPGEDSRAADILLPSGAVAAGS